MSDNVLDFNARKISHLERRKEARVDALKQAFTEARRESKPRSSKNKRKRSRKKKPIDALLELFLLRVLVTHFFLEITSSAATCILCLSPTLCYSSRRRFC
ncbi:MAG: hypothetical protein CMQ45_08610 [Gammaproteobacteria bacterium]|nr:hypothetical protein [Gammaproteobacteria bacterium]